MEASDTPPQRKTAATEYHQRKVDLYTPPLTFPAHHIHLITSSDWSDLPPLIPLCRYKYGLILSILIHTSSPVENGTDTGFRNFGF